MDKEIISLAEENRVEELVKSLEAATSEQLCELIERKVVKGRNDTFTLVRAILLGSPPDVSECVKRRCAVYRQCISALQGNDLNNKMALELVGLLMRETDALPGPNLAELANIYVEGLKSDTPLSAKSLKLLPKILSSMASRDDIVYGGNHMKGSEYKNHVLNTLCSCRWDPGSVINLADMFKDVPLTSEELKFVIEKVLRMFRELDLSDIPALVYQLLLLSTKGHKKLVLEGIMSFFSEHDRNQPAKEEQECSEDLIEDSSVSRETLRLTEGTVILHISFAVKEHQDLGREFIKCLKARQQCSGSQCLTPFSLALALSLSRINRFEEQIFDHLKSSILKSYRDLEKQGQSHWVKDIVPDMEAIDQYILQTIQNSTYGWDHVVQGLVQLGFLLMDSFGPKAVFGRLDLAPSQQQGPNHQCCKLGASTLLNTFKAHEMVRNEILDQIFNRVITKATAPASHFLGLLGDIILSWPAMLLDSAAKIREMFDYLAMLAPSTAEGLLHAIQPLLKHSMSLKDSLILVLRKAMFSRLLDSRKIGATGFLMMLKHFRVLGGLRSSQASQPSISSSQVGVDVHVAPNPGSNEALCLEILGNLRRCLTQQADVRLLLYQGLYDVLDRNSQLREPLLAMLMSQLKTYYERNTDVNPPLKLEPCIVGQGEQVFLAEPLAHLLTCIQLCVIKSRDICQQQRQQQRDDDDDDDDDEVEECETQRELEEILTSLTQRMITSEMEDFDLDKSADFSLANSVGVRNNIFAILLLGTYEALMEYSFMRAELSDNTAREILQLFEHYKRLSDILREKSTSATGKKGKASTKAPQSLLSLKLATQLLDALISSDTTANVAGAESLRSNTDLLRYTLTVVQQRVTQVQDRGGQCDGAEGKSKQKVAHYCAQLARLTLGYYLRHQPKDGEPQRVREKQLLTLTLECLQSLVTIATQQTAAEIDNFLEGLEVEGYDRSKCSSLDDSLYFHIKFLQRQVMTILTADEDDRCLKDVGLLLTIIVQLCKSLSTTHSGCEHILFWLDKLCREHSIEDLSLVKQMLTFLLSLGQMWKSCIIPLRDLAQDVHSHLGDIDQDIETDDRTNFATVTLRAAAPSVIQIILHQCEQELDDADWLIVRVKADTLASAGTQSGGESPGLTQREGHEKSICTRLGMLVNTFHELVQTALPIGPCTEHLLKVLVRMYISLTSLVKYYISLYTSSAGHLSGRFEKLVKLSGTNLTQQCYSLISYIQLSESEKMQGSAPDKGKKKAKEDKKKAGAGQAAKSSVLKQTKSIPNLVFSIEQYERYLIQLSKKSKVNLMEHMKYSTSRDFRINPTVLAETEEVSSESSDDDDDEQAENGAEDTHMEVEDSDGNSGTSDQENDPPAANVPRPPSQEPSQKKRKLGTKKTSMQKSRAK